MSVQVVYKNKAKYNNSGVVGLFCTESYKFKASKSILNTKENSYLINVLKNKTNKNNQILSINLNEKKTALIIPIKKNININELQNAGAKF